MMLIPGPTAPDVTAAERLSDRIASIGAQLDALTGSEPAVSNGAGRIGTQGFDAALARTGSVATSASTTVPPDDGEATWADQLPDRGRGWRPAIERAADQAGIEPALLASVVEHESGFEPTAVSRAGATGLAQQAGGVPSIAETRAYVDAVTDTYREHS